MSLACLKKNLAVLVAVSHTIWINAKVFEARQLVSKRRLFGGSICVSGAYFLGMK